MYFLLQSKVKHFVFTGYRRLEAKVKHLISKREDYKAWYYVPVSDRPAIVGYYEQVEADEKSGKRV